MCSDTHHIKLCTCEPESLDPNCYWALQRGVSEYWIGKFIAPDEKKFMTEEYLSAKILRDLNEHDVFDFEYSYSGDEYIAKQTQKIDYLTIRINDFVFEYVNHGDGFTHAGVGDTPKGKPYKLGSISKQIGFWRERSWVDCV